MKQTPYEQGEPLKPYKPRNPYATARNSYSNKRRDEEAFRLKQEAIKNGTWDENAYTKAKIVGFIIMAILAALTLYSEIKDAQRKLEPPPTIYK